MKRKTTSIILIGAFALISSCGSATNSSSQDDAPKFATDIVNKEHIYTLYDVKHYRAKDSNNRYGVVTESDSIVVPFAYERIGISTRDKGGAIIVGTLPWLENPRRKVGDDVYAYNGDKIIDSEIGLCNAKLTNEFPGICFSRYIQDKDDLYGVTDGYGNILMDSAINIMPFSLGQTEMIFKRLAPDPKEDEIYDKILFVGSGKKSVGDMFYVSDGHCISDDFTGGVLELTGKAIVLKDMVMTDASDKALSDMTHTIKFVFLKAKDGDLTKDRFAIEVVDGNYKSVLPIPEGVFMCVFQNSFDAFRENTGQKYNGIDIPKKFILQERGNENLVRVEIGNNKAGDDMRVIIAVGANKLYFSPVRASLKERLMYLTLDDSNLSWVWLADFLRFFDEWNNSK